MSEPLISLFPWMPNEIIIIFLKLCTHSKYKIVIMLKYSSLVYYFVRGKKHLNNFLTQLKNPASQNKPSKFKWNCSLLINGIFSDQEEETIMESLKTRCTWITDEKHDSKERALGWDNGKNYITQHNDSWPIVSCIDNIFFSNYSFEGCNSNLACLA